MFNICRTTIAFRLTCDPQLPCVHTAIASLRFSLALRPSALSLSFGFAAKRSLYSSAHLPPALRGASVCLNYSNRTAFSLCGWPHFDCFQATLLSTIAVCPQRLPIVFKLGLAAKRFLLFGPLTRYFAFLNCCASTAIASLYFRLALRPSALCIP